MDETERTNQETEPIMPKPPKPPPGRMPIDYYNQSVDGKDALAFEPPPMPAAPTTGDPNLMRLYVPSENTELDFGAGRTPGIRMATDRHVHLTARTPRTTISLGSPGGDGINDPAMGVQVYTQGEKRETIDGSTEENYKHTKTENVQVNLVENYDCPKQETVTGRVTEHYKAEHHLTVGKLATHEFKEGKVDEIQGDWNVHVTGDRHEKIDGDGKHYKTGNGWSLTEGKTNDIYVGEKSTAVLGANISLNAGASATVTNLVKTEVVSGGSVTITSPLKITRDTTTMAKTTLKIENVTAFHKEEAGVKTVKGEVSLDRVSTVIKNSTMFIIK